MTAIEEIKDLMRKHDWYYKYSDDRRCWAKGEGEKKIILEKLAKIPACEIPPLMEMVPEEVYSDWYVAIAGFRK